MVMPATSGERPKTSDSGARTGQKYSCEGGRREREEKRRKEREKVRERERKRERERERENVKEREEV